MTKEPLITLSYSQGFSLFTDNGEDRTTMQAEDYPWEERIENKVNFLIHTLIAIESRHS